MTAAAAQTSAIKAAMGVARELAEGQLSPAALDAVALEECRELFGHVAGPGDALWELQVDVARQVLGVGGGISSGELAEWLAVTRSAEGVDDEPRGPSWIELLLAEFDDEDEPSLAAPAMHSTSSASELLSASFRRG